MVCRLKYNALYAACCIFQFQHKFKYLLNLNIIYSTNLTHYARNYYCHYVAYTACIRYMRAQVREDSPKYFQYADKINKVMEFGI